MKLQKMAYLVKRLRRIEDILLLDTYVYEQSTDNIKKACWASSGRKETHTQEAYLLMEQQQRNEGSLMST